MLHQDDALVVINKPGSVPVHAAGRCVRGGWGKLPACGGHPSGGRYRHNTCLGILGREHGLWDLHPVHRLDRLTSGVLVIAKTKAAAADFEVQIRGHDVQKEYICRVSGQCSLYISRRACGPSNAGVQGISPPEPPSARCFTSALRHLPLA